MTPLSSHCRARRRSIRVSVARTGARGLVLLSLCGAGLTLGACSASDGRARAVTTVERFYDAIRGGRGEDACSLLSAPAFEQIESQSGQPCRDVIARLRYGGGTIVDAEVFVTNAKVDMLGGESAFLSQEPAGWKLTAVGCRAEAGKPRDHPLDCELKA